MSSIKCPNCGLVNFSTTQYCKRCNNALLQNSAGNNANETRVFDNVYDTSIRPAIPLQNNYQNEPQVGNQSYQPNQYRQQAGYQQPPQPSNDWTLPRFPPGQQPPNFNGHQQRQYQPANQYAVNEPAFRRFGSEIALHQNANLPGSCVKCGRHISSPMDGEFVSQKFRWHNPLVYIALISPLIYVILSLCLSKTFTVNVPYCTEHLQKRESIKTFLIGGSLSAFILIVLCSIFDVVGLAFLIFFVALFGLSIIHEYSFKTLKAKKVEGNYYYLGGASQEFLNNIPY